MTYMRNIKTVLIIDEIYDFSDNMMNNFSNI